MTLDAAKMSGDDAVRVFGGVTLPFHLTAGKVCRAADGPPFRSDCRLFREPFNTAHITCNVTMYTGESAVPAAQRKVVRNRRIKQKASTN